MLYALLVLACTEIDEAINKDLLGCMLPLKLGIDGTSVITKMSLGNCQESSTG